MTATYSIRDAARLFPARNGRHPSVRTIWRWMTEGLRGVKLHFGYVGCRRVITGADVAEFQRKTNSRRFGRMEAARIETLEARETLKRYGFFFKDETDGQAIPTNARGAGAAA